MFEGSAARKPSAVPAKAMSASDLKYGMSLFIAADTLIGPVYSALGRASGANAVYLFLGRP